MKCKLVDVFAHKKLTGNGLTIFYDFDSLTKYEMLILTREMKQFESIFLSNRAEDGSFRAHIFTVDEELDFAGHPLIGLGAHLHEEYGTSDLHTWDIKLNQQHVKLTSKPYADYYQVTMDQGKPLFIQEYRSDELDEIITAMSLKQTDMAPYPLEIISTGLPYLIVPIVRGIEDARIVVNNFEALLEKHGAKFAYILDINNFEGRTWDNQGNVEDIATGSAAGPSAAFLFKHKLVAGKKSFTLSQGRFLERPSKMGINLIIDSDTISNILVHGQVCKIANIEFV